MNGIFGIVKFDNAVITRDELIKMGAGCASRAKDGTDIWAQGPAGLGCLRQEQCFENRDSQPFSSGDLVAMVAARLDNRAELGEKLGVPSPVLPGLSDGILILRSFERWGENSVDHLLGDWAFCVWNKKKQTLFLARDHHGPGSLFYSRTVSSIVFASDIKTLFASGLVKKAPDSDMVSRHLSLMLFFGDRTLFKNVKQLPPAHHLSIDQNHPECRVKRYWSLENARLPAYRKDESYVEHFLSIFSDAVNRRLRGTGPIGVLLSGGLDSGSVAAVAAPLLASRNKPLYSISSIPLYGPNYWLSPDILGDEKPLIEKTVGYVGNITPSFIRAETIDPISAMEQWLDSTGQIPFVGPNVYWVLTAYRRASELNLSVLLTGQKGNETISWPGRERLVYLLLTGQIGHLIKELRAFSRHQGLSLTSAFIRHILGPLRQTMKSYVETGASVVQNNNWFKLVNPELAAGMSLHRAWIKEGYQKKNRLRLNPAHRRLILLQPGGRLGDNDPTCLGSHMGFEYRDPTVDKRVLEFCINLPLKEYLQDGMDRSLVRRSMSGRLPADVLSNRQRGSQAADILERIKQRPEKITSCLQNFRQSVLAAGHLNLSRLDELAQQAVHGSLPDLQSAFQLINGIGLGLFLLRF